MTACSLMRIAAQDCLLWLVCPFLPVCPVCFSAHCNLGVETLACVLSGCLSNAVFVWHAGTCHGN